MDMNGIKFALLAVLAMLCQIGHAQKYHDAAAFDAYGHVKWILTDVGLLYFNEDGRLDKSKSTALSDYEKYQIDRDAAGYVKKITTDFEVMTFAYDSDGKLVKKTVRGSGNFTTTLERDADNKYQTETTRVLSGRQENTSIKYNCNSDGSNWVCKATNTGGEMKSEKRVVGYWFDSSVYTGDPGKNISVPGLLDNPCSLSVDWFKCTADELKKMMKGKGLKVKSSSGLLSTDYPQTWRGLSVYFFSVSHSSKKNPYKLSFMFHEKPLKKTAASHTLTLMIDELLDKNIPLKVVARFGKYGMAGQLRQEYGVSFTYKGYPCELFNQIRIYKEADMSSVKLNMYATGYNPLR